MRRIVVYLGLALVVVAAPAWWHSGEAAGDWSPVERGDLSLTVDVEGVLKARSSRAFGPPVVPGMWQYQVTYMAPDGADVRKGARILAFDASELERRLREQRSELASARKEIEKKLTVTAMRKRDDELRIAEAEAKLEKARLKLDRPASLVAAKEIERLELELELSEIELAHLEARANALDEADRAELTALREHRDRALRRVRVLEDAIAAMTIHAPRDCSASAEMRLSLTDRFRSLPELSTIVSVTGRIGLCWEATRAPGVRNTVG